MGILARARAELAGGERREVRGRAPSPLPVTFLVVERPESPSLGSRRCPRRTGRQATDKGRPSLDVAGLPHRPAGRRDPAEGWP